MPDDQRFRRLGKTSRLRAPPQLALPAPAWHVPRPLPAPSPARRLGWTTLIAPMAAVVALVALLQHDDGSGSNFVTRIVLPPPPVAEMSTAARRSEPIVPTAGPRRNLAAAPDEDLLTALTAPATGEAPSDDAGDSDHTPTLANFEQRMFSEVDATARMNGLLRVVEQLDQVEHSREAEPAAAAPGVATWSATISADAADDEATPAERDLEAIRLMPRRSAAMRPMDPLGAALLDPPPEASATTDDRPRLPPPLARARPREDADTEQAPQLRTPRRTALAAATAAPSTSVSPASAPAAPSVAARAAIVIPTGASRAAAPELPPLPAPRSIATVRPVPPPDGFATAVAPASGTVGGAMSGTWVRHARPFDAKDLRPRVAVVVAELGLAQGPTDHAIHYLPGAVTLAFSPYAENLQKWIELARRAGHEVLLDLPMEARGSDGGPQALSPALPSDQNVARLDWTLARGTGHVGIALAAGARLMESDGALRPVLEALRERGFIFLDKQPGGSPALRMGRELGLPRAGVDRALDASPRREEIDARLAEIERQARESGTAVAIVQPHAISLERLAAWHTTLENKGIAIAPVSAVLNRQRIR